MAFQMEMDGKDKVHLTFKIERDKVGHAYNEFVNQVKGRVTVPGFRQNKIPRHVLLNHIGKQRVHDEIRQSLVKDHLREACEKEGLIPLTTPELKFQTEPSEGADFEFSATLNIVPLYNDLKYSGHSVSVPKIKVREEDVSTHLRELAERMATFTDLGDSPVVEGHFVKCHIEAYEEGDDKKAFEEEERFIHVIIPKKEDEKKKHVHGPDCDHDHEDESENPLGFEFRHKLMKSFINHKKGETVDFTANLPVDYPNDELAGKVLHFKIGLREVSAKVIPEINDEWVKKVEGGRFPSVANFRSEIEKRLSQSYEQSAKSQAFHQILDKVALDNGVTVHETLIEKEIDFRIQGLHQQMKQSGGGLDKYLQSQNMSFENFRASFAKDSRVQVEKDIQNDILIDTVARVENLTCGEEEMKGRFKRLSEQTGKSVLKLRAQYEAQGRMEALEKEILRDKVMDSIIAKNSVTYEEMSSKEFAEKGKK